MNGLPAARWRARDIARGVAAGELSATEAAQAVLARVERLNPHLGALVDVDAEGALAQAAAIDARARRGERLPLMGVPFTVKDNLWVKGRPATYGSRLYAGHRAPRDSWAVARLKAMGAVCIGITNTPEFACKGMTDNPLHGITRNPWDVRLTPGGSSGGAAAAVAAGLGPLALGTDAGGSTRRPAAHTGLAGFKCTLGLIPDPWGFDDASHDLSSIGVLARDVQDCALALDVLARHDPADPRSHPLPAPLDRPSAFSAALAAGPARGWRIAWTPDLGCGFAVDDDVAAPLAHAVQALRADGWAIDDARPQWPAGTFEYPLLARQQAGLAALFGTAWRDTPHLLDPDLGAQIEAGLRLSGGEVAGLDFARNRLRGALAQFFQSYDLLLCPTVPVEPWPCDGPPPARIGGRAATGRGHAAFTPLFNYADVPALSVPCGFGARGLPLGLQIVGPRYADDRVLAFGAHVQSILDLAMDSPMILDLPGACATEACR